MPTVIIPWRGGCEYREAALECLTERYRDLGWPVTIAETSSDPWVKARAVMPAILAAKTSIVIVADADVWSEQLEDAVAAVEYGAAWARPHRLVHRLDRQATADFIAGGRPQLNRSGGWGYDREPYIGIPGGGIVVSRRLTLLQIPLDPRFKGWGQEDESWAIALTALAGPPYKGDADLIHLWHPPQPRFTRRKGSPESWNLMRRYMSARSDPEQMSAILKEIR